MKVLIENFTISLFVAFNAVLFTENIMSSYNKVGWYQRNKAQLSFKSSKISDDYRGNENCLHNKEQKSKQPKHRILDNHLWLFKFQVFCSWLHAQSIDVYGYPTIKSSSLFDNFLPYKTARLLYY